MRDTVERPKLRGVVARRLKSSIRGLIAASGLSPLLAFGELLGVFFKRCRESVKAAEWAKGIESPQRILAIESHRGRLGTAT